MPKVLLAASALAYVKGNHMQRLGEAGFEVVLPARTGQLTEEDLLRDLPGAAAVLSGTEPYTRRVLENCKALRVIARAGVGYDNVDVPAATDHGVAVAITPGANHESVAEHTLAMILGLAKDLVPQDRGTRAGQWPRKANLPLRGGALGMVGLGRIGKAVAIRAASFNLRLLAYEPFPDKEFVARQRIELVPLEKLLAESDFISLHLPLSPDTKHVINKQTLALMKPTAFLINTARGGLVCEADLMEALKNKRIAGAALDVFETEPFIHSPLFAFDNVLLTPHAAGVDTQSLSDMAGQAADAIIALSKGHWPAEQIVNAELKGKFRW